MPRVLVTVLQLTSQGVASQTPVVPPADGTGLSFPNNPQESTWIEVTNVDTNPHNVSIEAPATLDGYLLQPLVVSIPASSTVRIGSFPADVFNQPNDPPNVYVDFPDSYANYLMAVYQL